MYKPYLLYTVYINMDTLEDTLVYGRTHKTLVDSLLAICVPIYQAS